MTPEQSEWLGQLYEKYNLKLCRYAYSILNDWQASEDMVQRTFEVACKKVSSLNPDTNAFGWLSEILKNEIRNFWRACETQKKYFSEFDPKVQYEHPDSAKYFDNLDYIRPKEVSAEDFTILKYVTVYGYTCSETAKLLKISSAACYKRYQRARKRAEKILKI